MNIRTPQTWRQVILIALAFLLAGCAASGHVVFHTFRFDASRDSTDVEVLRYRYGADGGFNTKSSQEEISAEKPIFGRSTTGQILVGNDLYVKWRVKSSGQVYEDTVDLVSRLPRDMEKQELRFIIEGPQLYVYVISHDPVRPYFSETEAARIRAFASTLRERALSNSGRNRVLMIYPRKEIDPHIPPEFRSHSLAFPKTVTHGN